MPHIHIIACNTRLNMQHVAIHATVQFSPEYFRSQKDQALMDSLQEELETVLQKYYDAAAIEAEQYSNHDWNIHMKEINSNY